MACLLLATLKYKTHFALFTVFVCHIIQCYFIVWMRGGCKYFIGLNKFSVHCNWLPYIILNDEHPLAFLLPLRCMEAQICQPLSWLSSAAPHQAQCMSPALVTCWQSASSLMLTSVVEVSMQVGLKSREVGGQQQSNPKHFKLLCKTIMQSFAKPYCVYITW